VGVVYVPGAVQEKLEPMHLYSILIFRIVTFELQYRWVWPIKALIS
jgi:hypothetical protein